MMFGLLLVMISIRAATGGCSFELRNRFGNAARGVFIISPFVGGSKAYLELGRGGRIRNLWGAKITEQVGNKVILELKNENRNDIIVIVDGTANIRGHCGGSDSHSETENGNRRGLLTPKVSVKSSMERLNELVWSLTSTVGKNSLGTIRMVQSSGGAAGGVVSQGQAYGLLTAGTAAAATATPEAIQYAMEFFNGWMLMSHKSKDDRSCQLGRFYCRGSPCLPHWKFRYDMSANIGTGSATNADEDAILGMILLLSATTPITLKWWDLVAEWTYQSCKSFMDFNTVHGTGEMLRMGSCWGGWNCANPSYFSPAHYRAFRNFMKKYRRQYGSDHEDYTMKWNKLIKTSYDIFNANQCPSTGLVTNWWKPSQSNPATEGAASCNGSGTPGPEFGSEASTAIWRVALDFIWHGDGANESLGAANFLFRTAKQATQKIISGDDLDTGCNVLSVHPDWLHNDFIWAPLSTALVARTNTPRQQEALDKAALKMNGRPINDYYPGCWVVIASQVFNQDTQRAGASVKSFLN